jgi:sugar/nucleoside kinase (ribokinase family)
VARQGQQEWSCPIIPVKTQDTVGAGDSFDAGYIHSFLRGASPEQCLQLANATGAYSTTHQGGIEAFRNPAEMNLFFETHLPRR